MATAADPISPVSAPPPSSASMPPDDGAPSSSLGMGGGGSSSVSASSSSASTTFLPRPRRPRPPAGLVRRLNHHHHNHHLTNPNHTNPNAALLRSHNDDPLDEFGNPRRVQCRRCLSPSLVLDVSAGDRVCTSCGVVDESSVRISDPEWREFDGDDDRAKDRPSAARSGLVPVDESRWAGGLQPTSLSRHPFGGAWGNGSGAVRAREELIRRRLARTNRRVDGMMERMHEERVKEALAEARRKRGEGGPPGTSTSTGSREEGGERASNKGGGSNDADPSEAGFAFERLAMKRERDESIALAALKSEKWSYDRAVLLHGARHEQRHAQSSVSDPNQRARDIEREREDLLKRLDDGQKNAARETYRAVRMLRAAARRLGLPDRAADDAASTLCRYAARRDGFKVRGVSKHASASSHGGRTKEETEEESERRRRLNRDRQMGALGSAAAYLAARGCGRGRTLKEVCAAFRLSDGDQVFGDDGRPVPNSNADASSSSSEDDVIKPKHCSRAMGEIKAVFPDYVRSVSRSTLGLNPGSSSALAASALAASAGGGAPSSSHSSRDSAVLLAVVERAAESLSLPSPAVESVRVLALRYASSSSAANGSKASAMAITLAGAGPDALCAALTLLVCRAGETMQKLARQATRGSAPGTSSSGTKRTDAARPAVGRSSSVLSLPQKQATGIGTTAMLGGATGMKRRHIRAMESGRHRKKPRRSERDALLQKALLASYSSAKKSSLATPPAWRGAREGAAKTSLRGSGGSSGRSVGGSDENKKRRIEDGKGGASANDGSTDARRRQSEEGGGKEDNGSNDDERKSRGSAVDDRVATSEQVVAKEKDEPTLPPPTATEEKEEGRAGGVKTPTEEKGEAPAAAVPAAPSAPEGHATQEEAEAAHPMTEKTTTESSPAAAAVPDAAAHSSSSSSALLVPAAEVSANGRGGEEAVVPLKTEDESIEDVFAAYHLSRSGGKNASDGDGGSSRDGGGGAFDALTHAPLDDGRDSSASSSSRAVWDAWSSQPPWGRDAGAVWDACRKAASATDGGGGGGGTKKNAGAELYRRAFGGGSGGGALQARGRRGRAEALEALAGHFGAAAVVSSGAAAKEEEDGGRRARATAKVLAALWNRASAAAAAPLMN